jgi:cardiolipin synthase A/B
VFDTFKSHAETGGMSGVLSAVLIANYALAAMVIVSVLRQRKEPMAMLSWIMAVLVLPFVGTLLYWLMGSAWVVRRSRRRRRRMAHMLARLEAWAKQQADGTGEEPDFPDDLRAIAGLGRRLADLPATRQNAVEIYQESEVTFAALEDAMREAKHHIHAEYYIWRPDETGLFFRDLLIEKARAGVECRVLLDSVGCFRVGRRFTRPFTQAGGQLAFFMPLRPFRKNISPQLRNHRKIVVIDGQVGFLGSQNIGDEYRGRLKKLSPWYDTHMRVEGPAALLLQRTFCEDWLFATRQDLSGETYFPEPPRPGHSIVQILPTGPEQNINPLEQILFAAVSSARHKIRIATPYFVPSPALRMAFTYACSRGVRVELVLPTRSDSMIVLWAGRSFYRELLERGVKIYEYDGGVVHSKLVTVDDRWCMLGSANMDMRSFRLNFEVTALIYDQAVTRELAASIDRFCHRARDISLRELRERRWHHDLLEGTARLLTPLL